MKNFLMAFDQIVAMTGGGPNSSTESISILFIRQDLVEVSLDIVCKLSHLFYSNCINFCISDEVFK